MERLGYTRYVAQGGDCGRRRHRRDGPPGTRRAARHPHQHARRGARRSTDATCRRRSPRGTRGARRARRTFTTDGIGYVLEMATRPQTLGYALLDSPVALAAWMLDHDTDSYDKISRAFVDGEPVGQPHPGRRPRQHHAVLADGHRRLRRPARTGRPDAPQPLRPARLRRRSRFRSASPTFPGELFGCPAQLGRGGLPRPRLLQRGRQGRPLRRLGGAGALLDRGARGVPVPSPMTTSLHTPSLPSALPTAVRRRQRLMRRRTCP